MDENSEPKLMKTFFEIDQNFMVLKTIIFHALVDLRSW